MPVIPALMKLMQEDCEFVISMSWTTWLELVEKREERKEGSKKERKDICHPQYLLFEAIQRMYRNINGLYLYVTLGAHYCFLNC
jgi:hypothetical protein